MRCSEPVTQAVARQWFMWGVCFLLVGGHQQLKSAQFKFEKKLVISRKFPEISRKKGLYMPKKYTNASKHI
jgi:hypothetical protein